MCFCETRVCRKFSRTCSPAHRTGAILTVCVFCLYSAFVVYVLHLLFMLLLFPGCFLVVSWFFMFPGSLCFVVVSWLFLFPGYFLVVLFPGYSVSWLFMFPGCFLVVSVYWLFLFPSCFLVVLFPGCCVSWLFPGCFCFMVVSVSWLFPGCISVISFMFLYVFFQPIMGFPPLLFLVSCLFVCAIFSHFWNPSWEAD